MIKTTRDISIAFIEANKNNRGLDLIGHKEWVDKKKLINKLLDLKNKNIRDNLPISTKKRMIGWNESIEVLMEYLGVDDAKKLLNDLNKELMNE